MGKNTDRQGPARTRDDGIIPKHGGFKNTRTWQLADLIYDITVLFCDKYVNARSRTHDQMVQAARSGCQNLQEGSVDSATSKKIELKLTGIAKGSLMELQRDFQKFLQHRNLPEWPPDHAALTRFRARRCATLQQFRMWVADEVQIAEKVRGSQCSSVTPSDLPAVLAANGALSLLNLCVYLIGRQMEAQAAAFEREGGFTERLYRMRSRQRME